MKLTVVRALVPVTMLIFSPMLLIAGTPIRRRYLRYVYRHGPRRILDKERGWVSVHYFVITSRLLEWFCQPTEMLARLASRRG